LFKLNFKQTVQWSLAGV